MINITDQQWDVLVNIIGAVETGDQIYGKRRYDDFTEAYTNSSNETSITIGAFQEYGNLAKGLLQEILCRYPEVFEEFDYAGVREDLNRITWNCFNIPKNSAKADAIRKIISTDEGKTVQDERIIRQMKEYIEYGVSLGVTNIDALFEICNFCHQGGRGAAKRIISKTNRPYTLENLYRACQSDTGNQVGTYRQRQKFVYNAIKQHMQVDGGHHIESSILHLKNGIIESAVQWMIDLANDDSHGYDQTYRWGERGDYDCSSAVITAYRYAGLDLEWATYTGNMRAVFMNNGFIDVTGAVNLSTGAGLVMGDVLLNEVHHTAMYIGDGQEAEASINEFGGATGGRPGDQTGREVLIRPYRNYPWDLVLRYAGKAQNVKNRPLLQLYDSGYSVKTLQTLLNDNGADLDVDGEFGALTLEAVKDFQRRHILEVDGIVGEQTWYALDHQIYKVLKTPGVIRQSPRKRSKHILSLNAGVHIRVYGAVYNDSNNKWCKVDGGYIIASNLERV